MSTPARRIELDTTYLSSLILDKLKRKLIGLLSVESLRESNPFIVQRAVVTISELIGTSQAPTF